MELASRWLDHRLSLLEGIMAWLLIAIVIGLFSRYMFAVFSKAEQSMINSTVININTAINYKAAFALIKGDNDYAIELLKMNPMELMTENIDVEGIEYATKEINSFITIKSIGVSLPNYGGVVFDDSEPLLEAGKWYFDQDDYILFYKLENTAFFNSDLQGPTRIRFRVSFNFVDQDGDNIFNPLVDEFSSMGLEKIDDYSWSY